MRTGRRRRQSRRCARTACCAGDDGVARHARRQRVRDLDQALQVAVRAAAAVVGGVLLRGGGRPGRAGRRRVRQLDDLGVDVGGREVGLALAGDQHLRRRAVRRLRARVQLRRESRDGVGREREGEQRQHDSKQGHPPEADYGAQQLLEWRVARHGGVSPFGESSRLAAHRGTSVGAARQALSGHATGGPEAVCTGVRSARPHPVGEGGAETACDSLDAWLRPPSPSSASTR